MKSIALVIYGDNNSTRTEEKYTLCEMNVSGISPFPPSCAGHIAKALKDKIGNK
jgi:hypothetical protein